ncbi:phage tail assembly chaperone [Aneurinibacillus migulanus]|uniref:Phage XkdN-like tail assembly chaperone protein, TAC n=1 Tax=Aneurinibacillus migulanus TaxID=47500 RepID=A0A0D1Y751_ANEMI|nr:hypothetical protein [Aneurinibacillus migulanus]KIV60278.1 hypothetical protein TS65_00385 [Aneurinibacillus migulanus]KON90523.1 hypothetical protein AF333_29020 [Aneurinibacillus migulanus]MED0894894.1 phage portal protein [Aneurinibacillus migulanus]MED1614463.1 phage portal protein [Aneurinibacillus migulanus]SDJ77025.1 Phage XkdN-like tail assembly chaperone protein, TAC [Aneurinibacillus migulanus]
MSDMNKLMQAFMKGNAKPVQERKFQNISDRYVDEKGNPIPFVMKAIPQSYVEEIRAKHTRTDREGNEKYDAVRANAEIAVKSTKFPDFTNPELLASYGEQDPIDLAKRILSIPGEYANWISAATEVNGYTKDFEELVEDAKN